MKQLTKIKKDESKMDAAKRIMEICYKEESMERKDILPILIDKVGLTPKGAATYYYTIKRQLDA